MSNPERKFDHLDYKIAIYRLDGPAIKHDHRSEVDQALDRTQSKLNELREQKISLKASGMPRS